MRLIVVLAGVFGFLTVLAGSFLWNKPLDESIVNGIVSAFVAGILFRWWLRLWITSLEQSSRNDEIVFQQETYDAQMSESPPGSKSSEFRRP
jgi:pilus assembly protein TadC